jgi:hypothetical protein
MLNSRSIGLYFSQREHIAEENDPQETKMTNLGLQNTFFRIA